MGRFCSISWGLIGVSVGAKGRAGDGTSLVDEIGSDEGENDAEEVEGGGYQILRCASSTGETGAIRVEGACARAGEVANKTRRVIEPSCVT